MTKGELIELLKEYPDDIRLVISHWEDGSLLDIKLLLVQEALLNPVNGDAVFKHGIERYSDYTQPITVVELS